MHTRRNIVAIASIVTAASLARVTRVMADDYNFEDRGNSNHGSACDHHGNGVPPFCQCLTRGTFVLMSDGWSRTVEDVKIGDCLQTHDGPQEVVEIVQYKSTEDAVLFEAGSMGRLTPSSDLCVSRAHAVMDDGVLMDAAYFANRKGVRLIKGREHDYFHFKTKRHSAMWANGMQVETLDGPDTLPCLIPIYRYNGGWSMVRARLRSLFSTKWWDLRTPLDKLYEATWA